MIRLLILSSLILLSSMPAPASAVNAASVLRARCKATPPEYRSAKCRRLVGNN